MQNTISEETVRLSCLMNSTERCAALIAFCEIQNFVRGKKKRTFFKNPSFLVYNKTGIPTDRSNSYKNTSSRRTPPLSRSPQLTQIQLQGQLSRYSDSPGAGGSGDRKPAGVSFYFPAQTDLETYPAFCARGIGSFLRAAADHL